MLIDRSRFQWSGTVAPGFLSVTSGNLKVPVQIEIPTEILEIENAGHRRSALFGPTLN